MVKSNIRKILNATEQLSYKVLTPKQREWLKNSLTDKQKFYIKKILFSGKWQRAEITQVKHRLYNLGFTKRGLTELEVLCQAKDEPYLNRLANWELALWHANQYDKDHAQKCLELLPKAIQDEADPNKIRQAAIMEAECYEILGDIPAAKEALSKALATGEHADTYLAAANLETSMTKRLNWVNKALDLYEINHVFLTEENEEKLAYDRLGSNGEKYEEASSGPKVTIIMPVYNAEDVIETSLDSILAQTWTNLEVLVVDDCSPDQTASMVEEYEKKDARVKLLRAKVNGGAYAARNLALKEATGDFITINDADDWSHVQKIELQVRHLVANPDMIGNTSQQARATNDMKFYRRGKPGTYIFSNMSSFMFRREAVTEKLGFWDTVRFAADSEFIRRIKKVFGEKSIIELPTGPLSFQRQTESSLTGNSAFGYHGFKMGVRREYEEAHDYFHAHTDNFYYDFPQTVRPFPVPEPMWTKKEEKSDGYRSFDVLIAADYRLSENDEFVQEIKTAKENGLKIGLVQMFQYEVSPDKKVHSLVRDLLDGDQVQMVVYGEKIICDALVIRDARVLQEWQKHIPQVKANAAHVVIIDVSLDTDREKDETAPLDLSACYRNFEEYFAQKPNWYPINSHVRNTLINTSRSENSSLNLADKDWDLGEVIIERVKK
ncbi:glycosyltransferase [Alkalihalobacterium elongatum]|uniref:glycosyltransferase n=1 Tax=Alkalihalobacterium elongatum TaxID=2675466 RepID=UPI001C1F6AFE|nr:glycosyltransferase [Alkalihalobacterium elongatum]